MHALMDENPGYGTLVTTEQKRTFKRASVVQGLERKLRYRVRGFQDVEKNDLKQSRGLSQDESKCMDFAQIEIQALTCRVIGHGKLQPPEVNVKS